MRRSGVVALAAVALLFGTAAPAQAHAGVVLTVRNDGHGAVAVDIAWSDGHPVTASVAGTLIAISSAGTQVGPDPLSRPAGASPAVYRGTLTPGTWQVTVDLALPGIGHCATDIAVAARAEPARPDSVRCGPSPQPAAAPAPAPSRTGPVLLFAAAGVIAVGTAASVLLRRRRR